MARRRAGSPGRCRVLAWAGVGLGVRAPCGCTALGGAGAGLLLSVPAEATAAARTARPRSSAHE